MKRLLLATAVFAAFTVAARAGEVTYEQYKKLNDGISYEATVKLLVDKIRRKSPRRVESFQ